MTTMLVIGSLTSFIGPITINRLLAYIEDRGGQDRTTVDRPWFWIVALFVAPLAKSVATQCYYFYASQTLVRTEAIVTQLVFEHALKVRLTTTSTTDEEKDQVILDSSSNVGGSEAEPPTAVPGREASGRSNLIGKITNLVSTDLGNVVEG